MRTDQWELEPGLRPEACSFPLWDLTPGSKGPSKERLPHLSPRESPKPVRALLAAVRARRWIVLVWACFLARLVFYSAMLPVVEGYDEWAHFAVVRQIALGGKLLAVRDAPIPRDVEASFALAPVPWEMRALQPPAVTEDGFWQLSQEERTRRESTLRSMPSSWGREGGSGAFTAYEALQAPLYYWLMAPALWLFRALGAGLTGQVLALRILSSLIASLIVPLVFLVGRQVWDDENAALGSAAIAAVMPGLALDVARVGNDCLAVVLFSALTLLALRIVRKGLNARLALASGLVLGLGLLTKAYFWTAIPALAGVWVYAGWKARDATGHWWPAA